MADRLLERIVPPVRPDFVLATVSDDSAAVGEIARPLSRWERMSNRTAFRRVATLLPLILGWELYARWIDNPLMFPTFSATAVGVLGRGRARQPAAAHADLDPRAAHGLRHRHCARGGDHDACRVDARIGTDLLSTLTAMFNPLPAIALLPLALLWFGLGIPSLLFVIVHSVLWAVALNTHTGFLGGLRDAANGRPELRPAWPALRAC